MKRDYGTARWAALVLLVAALVAGGAVLASPDEARVDARRFVPARFISFNGESVHVGSYTVARVRGRWYQIDPATCRVGAAWPACAGPGPHMELKGDLRP